MSSHRFSNPVLFGIMLFMLALGACSPISVPDIKGAGTPIDLPPRAVLEAITQLSQELGISVEEIEIVEFEQVDWPDACLGITQEGQACAQVVTPGFRIVLEVNGQQYQVRSNLDGTLLVRVPEK